MPLIKKNIKYLLLIPIYFFSFLLVVLIKILKPIISIRFGQISSSRVGHLILNTELYLLNIKKKNTNKIFDFIYLEEKISNKYAIKVFKKKIFFYPRIIVSKLHNINRFIFKDKDLEIPEFQPGGDIDKNSLLSKFPNDFEFSKDEINIGDQNLKAMGLVPNSKIILFCIRDEVYLKKEHSYKDFSYHNYRNWDSDLFVESAECLASKGYSVIRMGSLTKKKFISSNPHIIDYANSKFRSDFMDFYLGYKSFFCVTTGTGMDSFSNFFRKKLAQIHLPFHAAWANNNNLISTCHHYSLKEKRLLNISEIFYYLNKINFTVNSHNLKNLGIQIQYHSKEHLKDFCLEAVNKFDGNVYYSDQDKNIQKQFWEIFNENIKKYNLSSFHGPIHGPIKASFDINFLRSNLDWLN